MVTLPNRETAYYEKEYFCEPSICQRYIIIKEGKILEIIAFPRLGTTEDYQKIIDGIFSTLQFTD